MNHSRPAPIFNCAEITCEVTICQGRNMEAISSVSQHQPHQEISKLRWWCWPRQRVSRASSVDCKLIEYSRGVQEVEACAFQEWTDARIFTYISSTKAKYRRSISSEIYRSRFSVLYWKTTTSAFDGAQEMVRKELRPLLCVALNPLGRSAAVEKFQFLLVHCTLRHPFKVSTSSASSFSFTTAAAATISHWHSRKRLPLITALDQFSLFPWQHASILMCFPNMNSYRSSPSLAHVKCYLNWMQLTFAGADWEWGECENNNLQQQQQGNFRTTRSN